MCATKRLESRRKGRRSLRENALARGYGQVWKPSNQTSSTSYKSNDDDSNSIATPTHLVCCLNFYMQKLRWATGTRIEGRPLQECKYKQASVGSHRVQTDDFQTTYKKLVWREMCSTKVIYRVQTRPPSFDEGRLKVVSVWIRLIVRIRSIE